jgi:CspA family cold shock protein
MRSPALSAVVVFQFSSRTGPCVKGNSDSFEKTGEHDDMQTGTIKKLVSDRGFGFIAAEDGKEYFFHRSGTEADFDSLNGGEKVTFEIEASPKGPRAKSVRVA